MLMTTEVVTGTDAHGRLPAASGTARERVDMRHRTRRRTSAAGFGLIELLIVIVIIGILAMIAVPMYLDQRDKAREAAIKANLRGVRIALDGYLLSDRSRTYRRSDNGGAAAEGNAARYVSNALELGLEQGVPGSNADGYMNPYTQKLSIVNWSSIYTNATYCPPAVFITNAADCRWARINTNARRTWLRGTIMVVWNTADGVIETYGVGGDGRRLEGTLQTMPL